MGQHTVATAKSLRLSSEAVRTVSTTRRAEIGEGRTASSTVLLPKRRRPWLRNDAHLDLRADVPTGRAKL